MGSDPKRAADLVQELEQLVTGSSSTSGAMLHLDEGQTLYHKGLDRLNVQDVYRLQRIIHTLPQILPESAFPVMVSKDAVAAADETIQLAGIPVHRSEAEDVIEDLVIIQQAVQDLPQNDASSYCIGLRGRLTPQNPVVTVTARSPLEAVMKFAATKVALNGMEFVAPDIPEVDAGSYEMRTRHDWSKFDAGLHFQEACQKLNAVLEQRQAAPEPLPDLPC